MHANGGVSFYNVRHLFPLFFFNVPSSRMTWGGIAFPSSLYLDTLSKLYSFANTLASLSIHTNPSGSWLTAVSCPFGIQYVQCVLNSPSCHSASCIRNSNTLFLFLFIIVPIFVNVSSLHTRSILEIPRIIQYDDISAVSSFYRYQSGDCLAFTNMQFSLVVKKFLPFLSSCLTFGKHSFDFFICFLIWGSHFSSSVKHFQTVNFFVLVYW